MLATVLASGLGPARKIGPARLLRPVIAAAVIIPLSVDRPSGHGSSLAAELAGAAGTGTPVSRAGWPYAIFWTNQVSEASVTAVLGVRAFRRPAPGLAAGWGETGR